MRSKFTTTLDSELIKAIKVQAIKENTNVSNILERLIKDYLKLEESEHKKGR